MSREIRLEDLLGRRIEGAEGQSIGHVEEVVAEWEGDHLVVRRYLIGVRGLLVRLLGGMWRSPEPGLGPSYAARWDQVDVTDPRRPRLTCAVEDLERLSPAPPGRGR